MTLDEAINYHRIEVDRCLDDGRPNAAAALKLGIEALEKIQRIRQAYHSFDKGLLPGETED